MPIAELQYAGKPAFVFDRAAHPEVVIAPQQLCRDEQEMADKLDNLLAGRSAPFQDQEVVDLATALYLGTIHG